jgi:2-oxoglutarate dehydrogenase E2 component (dihydrolipoamide succinyltransferase)
VDVSVAVSSPRGLVVPVLRNVEAMSLSQIEGGLADLAKRARADQIALEEMAGGTFTVSNGGVFGSLMGTPIINPPQSAILGMHAIKQRPVAINVRVRADCAPGVGLTGAPALLRARRCCAGAAAGGLPAASYNPAPLPPPPPPRRFVCRARWRSGP